MVDLDDTVDEVKKQVREAEDPDYEELLEQEKEGKDRKTIKEFLEKRIDSEEDTEDEEQVEEEVDEQLVEAIEEETTGGLLGGFTRSQVLAGGAMAGLIVGLIVGAMVLPMQQGISGQEAADRVETLITAGGQMNADQVDITSERVNGMHYLNVTATRTINGTERTQSQTYYMTSNGNLMFPEQIQSPLGSQQVAIDVAQALDRANNPQPPVNETTNQTN